MTIKDIAARVGISQQAIRARIMKETGKASGEYTDNGSLTDEGLQLVAALYFDGCVDLILHKSPSDGCLSDCDKQTTADNQLTQPNADNLSQEVARLSQLVVSLSQDKDNLSQQLAATMQSCDNLTRRNAHLEESLLREVERVGELTRTITDQASSITRLADQAQQLQLASLATAKKSIWLRLLGK